MSLTVKTIRMYKKREVEVLEVGTNLTKISDEGNEFWVKNDQLKAKTAPRIPKSLSIITITEELKPFVEYLKTPGANTLLYLEAQCIEMDFAVRKQYTAITGGEELVEGQGYNVAPNTANKAGCEGIVAFTMPADASIISAEVTAMMKQRPGLINRIGFVWALVEAGFRVTRQNESTSATCS